MDKTIIGVDGGGTQTRIVAVRGDGVVLGYGMCQSMNYKSSDIETCGNRLFGAIGKLLGDIGLDRFDYLSIGLSALNGEASHGERARFIDGRVGLERVYMHCDAYMALIGSSLGSAGIMIISGTGSMGVALDAKGEYLCAGGYGYLFGDEGSAFYIANRGIVSAFHEMDGYGTHTALTECLKRRYDAQSVHELLDIFYAEDFEISEIAQFARDVIACSIDGDAEAGKIIDDAIEILTNSAVLLLRKIDVPSCRVGIYGGLFEHHAFIVDAFTQRLQERMPGCWIGFPEFAPELGAVIHYFIKNNLLSQTVLDNMRRTK